MLGTACGCGKFPHPWKKVEIGTNANRRWLPHHLNRCLEKKGRGGQRCYVLRGQDGGIGIRAPSTDSGSLVDHDCCETADEELPEDARSDDSGTDHDAIDASHRSGSVPGHANDAMREVGMTPHPSGRIFSRPTGTKFADMPNLTASTVSSRLVELGLSLPDAVRPSRLFSPALAHNGIVTTSGQVPVRNGELVAAGTVGALVDLAAAQECARQCVLNALAAVAEEIGELDQVDAITRMVVYVASAPGFHDQPAVADAASVLLADIFGARGIHARSAVGVAALPRRAPVEIELTVAYTPVEAS